MQRIRGWASHTAVYDPKARREVYKYMGTRYLNEIWNWALIHFAVKSDLTNPPGLNLANGVLAVDIQGTAVSWKLEKHSPKNYFLYCSDVVYNPKADSLFCDRLLECLDEAPRTAFLRQVAAALDLASVRKVRGRDIRAAICRGSGSNGKDSLHEAIALIFTDGQICSAGFSQFISYDSGRQFTLMKLRGKKINWASENNKKNTLDNSEALNIAISGDRGLEYERKGRDAEPFIAECIHFFNVNQLPKISTGLESIMSRFAVYDFNKTFSGNPNPARGELQAEPRFKYDRQFVANEVCPALLNKILEELKNLMIHGIDYDSIKQSLDDIQE
jgi:putative DNA primase/helicase